MTPEAIARFWAKVDKSGDCWLWTGCVGTRTRDWGGYGLLTAERRKYRAHRFSFELHHGPIPVGLFVCHRCDVRHCVNPAHLFLGTHQENMADMGAKGRRVPPQGERHASARLTASDVREMRAIRASGWTFEAIGKLFGVHSVTAYYAVAGRTWRHLGTEPENAK